MTVDEFFRRAMDWDKGLCKKPRVHNINGRNITLLCMRERGHEGECMEALAAPENPDA